MLVSPPALKLQRQVGDSTSKNHSPLPRRTTESQAGRDLKGHLVQPFLANLGLGKPAQPLSSLIVAVSNAEDSTTALGSLFQRLIGLVKNVMSVVTNQNLPGRVLYPSPLVFST